MLDSFIKTVKFDLLTSNSKEIKKHTLSRGQLRRGLTDLSDNPHIVIKKADKGSVIVVMTTNDYIREAMRQLNTKDNYLPLDSDPMEEFSKDIREVLQSIAHNAVIDEDNFDYLQVPKPGPGRFYLIPKIHKPCKTGRPIGSSNNHTTENISHFVDQHNSKYVSNLLPYVRDTQHFIKPIKALDSIPKGSIIATLDVCSLYMNIPNQEALDAI